MQPLTPIHSKPTARAGGDAGTAVTWSVLVWEIPADVLQSERRSFTAHGHPQAPLSLRQLLGAN